MEVLAELIKSIFAGAGILGVFSFLSVAVNIGLVYYLINKTYDCYLSGKCPLKDIHIDSELASHNKALIESLTHMIDSLKKELEIVSLTEHQPMREMLIKITASIELLAKTIEYAASHDRDR